MLALSFVKLVVGYSTIAHVPLQINMLHIQSKFYASLLLFRKGTRTIRALLLQILHNLSRAPAVGSHCRAAAKRSTKSIPIKFLRVLFACSPQYSTEIPKDSGALSSSNERESLKRDIKPLSRIRRTLKFIPVKMAAALIQLFLRYPWLRSMNRHCSAL